MTKRLWNSYKQMAIRLHDEVYQMPDGEEFKEVREMLSDAARAFEEKLDSIVPTEES